jgi:uncharacterized protein DUF3606
VVGVPDLVPVADLHPDLADHGRFRINRGGALHPLSPICHPTMGTKKRKYAMSEHHDAPKAHEPHALHENHASVGPHNPKEINPKMASDIAYWSKEFGVTGDQLHEFIRSHGTHVDKARAALQTHKGV